MAEEILTMSDEGELYYLVKECPRAEAYDYISNQYKILDDKESKWWFLTVTIPPEHKLNIRGVKKQFKDCNTRQQKYFFKNRIRQINKLLCCDFQELYLIIEHHLNGSIHFHTIVYSNDYTQNIIVQHKELFGLKNNKYDSLVINISKCDNLGVNYFFKKEIDLKENENIKELNEYNEYIKKKQYEISKDFVFIIKRKEKANDFLENFND